MTTSSPAASGVAITPHDSTNFETPCRGIYVGVSGDISVQMKNTGTALIFKGVPQGVILPIQAKRVNATATTATDLVALY